MGATLSQLWAPKLITVGFPGFPLSGKTSIAYKLMGKPGPVPRRTGVADIPLHEIFQGNQQFNFYEYSGHEKIRCIWRRVLWNFDAVVFVIDCTDRESLPEIKQDFLNAVLRDCGTSEHPVLVFANKQDCPKAISVDDLIEYLGVQEDLEDDIKKPRPFHIQPCSALTGEGLTEGLEWLRQAVKAHPIEHRPSGAW